MKNKALSTFLTFSILVTSAIVASAGTETQLTQDELLTQGTSIYGNHVYWTESAGNGVHAYDLTNGERTDIDGHLAYSQINSYGNKVVWTGDDGEAVYMYDFSIGNETKISSGGSFPDIYGNYVVYTNNFYQDYLNDGIYLYDLNTNNETKIATAHGYPAIYDKKVVWSQANSNNGYDLCLYDISTNQTSIITTTSSPVSESELDIYGNTTVWTESHNVYMYDIASNETTQVTNSGNAYEPAIYGNWIVYTIDDPYSGDIYIYEISTARTTRITASTLAFAPSVYGDKIVYADSRNSEYGDARDIYLYDLSNTSNNIVANFTSNVTSGIAPLNVSFTDISTGTPNAWYWDFGDGAISNEQDPTHTYLSAGNYTACLTVSNANGTDSKFTTINVSEKPGPLLPVANFSSNVTSGYAPLTVQFTDLSQNAAGWNWDFGDGTNSTEQGPTHTYSSAGTYTVKLTATNENYTDSKLAIIAVLEFNVLPIANFTANPTSGYSPLTVQFTDLSQNAESRSWDFGDGTNSTEKNPSHTYLSSGNYLVNFTVRNTNGTDSKFATITAAITVLEQTVPVRPVADFSSNLISGVAPFDVQFTDASQNATGWKWDFGDGCTSTEQNPTHTYFSAGIHLVSLIVSNVNGTASKTATIYVLEKSGSSGRSSSSSVGGGAGGSPEPQSNVEAKEISQTFIASGKAVKFEFPRNATSVVSLIFDSKKTAGKTTTIVENLKEKSTLVTGLPSDQVYKYINIWVGNSGFATPSNIENSVICFKVDKSWIQDKKIDESSIILNRFSDKKWNSLLTNPSGEDDKYLYFTAKTPGFSPFVITGKTKATGTEIQPATGNKKQSAVDNTQNKSTTGSKATSVEQTPEQNQNQNTSGKENTKTPGFEITSCIFCLLSVFLYKRR